MNIRELADQAGLKEAVLLRVYGTEDALCDSEIAVLRQIEKFAELVAAHEREECAKMVGEAAKKWWSIHCATNKHMETTRKAHDEFCTLQAGIRARGKA